MTATGAITSFPIPTVGGGPTDIAAGGDGNLWFANNISDPIGRATPAGVVTEFSSLANPGAPTIPQAR